MGLPVEPLMAEGRVNHCHSQENRVQSARR
jgi:hypothetical protein